MVVKNGHYESRKLLVEADVRLLDQVLQTKVSGQKQNQSEELLGISGHIENLE